MLDWLFSDPLAVGTPAPEFSTTDDQGKPVSLSSLKGKNVVLVFYPADDTTVCTKQLCEFRDSWDAVQGKNAVVFGVNPAGGESHGKFRAKHQLPFPILVDSGQAIGKAYKAYGAIVPKRTVYLIGPDGRIRYGKRGKPEPAEVLAAAV
jgi:peroxiredoxin Q/BCP